MYICMCVCLYAYICVYIYIHIETHAHIYIYIYYLNNMEEKNISEKIVIIKIFIYKFHKSVSIIQIVRKI